MRPWYAGWDLTEVERERFRQISILRPGHRLAALEIQLGSFARTCNVKAQRVYRMVFFHDSVIRPNPQAFALNEAWIGPATIHISEATPDLPSPSEEEVGGISVDKGLYIHLTIPTAGFEHFWLTAMGTNLASRSMLAVVRELDGGKVVISDVTLQEHLIDPSSLSFVGKFQSWLRGGTR
jgi:hypothetical protein